VWDDAGDNIVEHVAGVDDFEAAVATLRWPKAKITLRQGARVGFALSEFIRSVKEIRATAIHDGARCNCST